MEVFKRLLWIFSRCARIGGKKAIFIICTDCRSLDDVYNEYGDLFFLGIIPTGIMWEWKCCEKCGNIQERTLKLSPRLNDRLKKLQKSFEE